MLKEIISRTVEAFSDVPALHSVEIAKYLVGYADGIPVRRKDLYLPFDPSNSELGLNEVCFASPSLAPRAHGTVIYWILNLLDIGDQEHADGAIEPYVRLLDYEFNRKSAAPNSFVHWADAQLEIFDQAMILIFNNATCQLDPELLNSLKAAIQSRFGSDYILPQPQTDVDVEKFAACLARAVDPRSLSQAFTNLPKLQEPALSKVEIILGMPLDACEAKPDFLYLYDTMLPGLLKDDLIALQTGDQNNRSFVALRLIKFFDRLLRRNDLNSSTFLLSDGQLDELEHTFARAEAFAAKEGASLHSGLLSGIHMRFANAWRLERLRKVYADDVWRFKHDSRS